MSYIEANDQNFAEIVEKSDIPVIVDFWAPWCAPCRMLAPTFEKLANEYEGKVKFVKVNVDENPTTAIKYMVQWIPTVMIFKEGKPYKTMVWVKPEDEYKAELNALIWENTNNQSTENKGESKSDSSSDGEILNINGPEEFTKALEENKDKLIIADFWAPWCGPCRMLAPTLEKLAQDYAWKIKVIKVNVDEPVNQPLAMQFQVSSIPTIAFIKWNDQIEVTVGALPYEALKDIIEKKLNS